MPGKDKFEDTMYVTVYELARDGLPDTHIAKSLGVAYPTYANWVKRRPALADAAARGRHHRDPGDEFTFHNYVYDRLPDKLRATWDAIQECEKAENGIERIEALLGKSGIRARQHLFIYSLTQTQFNVSKSMRKLNIPRKDYQNWCANDPDFAALIDEIHFHKKNFFESAFIRQVHAGNILAVLHGVKTQCRDRGYNDKIEIQHSGTVTHNHTVSVTDLDLPVTVRQTILAALRAHTLHNTTTATNTPADARQTPLLAYAGGDD